MRRDCARPPLSFPCPLGRFLFPRPWLQDRRECFRSSLLVMVVSYFGFWLSDLAFARSPKLLLVCRLLSFMLRDQKRENGGQQHENQRLHESDQHLQEIKWDRKKGRKYRHHV